jgi:hypothetical protein
MQLELLELLEEFSHRGITENLVMKEWRLSKAMVE